MPEEWEFMAALPGTSIREPVDAGRLAIVRAKDDRCSEGNLQESERVKRYLSRFRTIGTEPLDSLLILRRLGTKPVTGDDVTFLRNSLAIAVVLLARADRCRRPSGTGPTFSDAFDLPVVSLRRGPGLIIDTPGLLTTGPGEEFCGHPSPAYPYGKKEQPT
jgi:hypothetical protein